MAEERNLGLARAPQVDDSELSKEVLQQRMEVARDSISQTVTEIKETVAHQVEAVKDALDWREQFRKRPVAWSVGAAGVGFCVGYCIAAFVKGNEYDVQSSSYGEPHVYAGQPILGQSQTAIAPSFPESDYAKDDGPGLVERFKETRAFDRLQKEVGTLGDRLVEELSTTAQAVVLPALIRKVREWIGADLSDKSQSATSKTTGSESRPASRAYEPVLERNPS